MGDKCQDRRAHCRCSLFNLGSVVSCCKTFRKKAAQESTRKCPASNESKLMNPIVLTESEPAPNRDAGIKEKSLSDRKPSYSLTDSKVSRVLRN
jgi:hypothetical protein